MEVTNDSSHKTPKRHFQAESPILDYFFLNLNKKYQSAIAAKFFSNYDPEVKPCICMYMRIVISFFSLVMLVFNLRTFRGES